MGMGRPRRGLRWQRPRRGGSRVGGAGTRATTGTRPLPKEHETAFNEQQSLAPISEALSACHGHRRRSKFLDSQCRER